MQRIIGPHHPIDKPARLTGRNIDTDLQPTTATFRPNEPLGRSIIAGTFFNPLSMHPAATATGQHG
jgi:hypothetical protein